MEESENMSGEMLAVEEGGEITSDTVRIDLPKTQKCSHGREGPCEICRNPFYDHVWKLVHEKNRNVLMLIEGPPGSGKSWTSLRIASALDPGFNSETLTDRVIFQPERFLDLLKKADPKNPEHIPGKLYKGAVIILEEFGIQDDHRKWFSYNNTFINYILQTFRFLNLIVIFNVPVAEYIDSDARKLFQFHIETMDILMGDGLVKTKVKEQSYNSTNKKVYRKFLRYKVNGEWIRFECWYFKKPPIVIYHRYENMHREYKLSLYHDLYSGLMTRKIDEEERRTRVRAIDMKAAVQHVEEHLADFRTTAKQGRGRGEIDIGLVEAHFNVGRHQANRIKKEMELRLRRRENENQPDNIVTKLRKKRGDLDKGIPPDTGGDDPVKGQEADNGGGG